MGSCLHKFSLLKHPVAPGPEQAVSCLILPAPLFLPHSHGPVLPALPWTHGFLHIIDKCTTKILHFSMASFTFNTSISK